MRRIEIFCMTELEAEEKQDELYMEYDSVQCVNAPLFTEAGYYSFIVK
jgi:hypothetical protein